MSKEYGWYEPPMKAVIHWINCIECGKKFRMEDDRVLNVGDVQEHAMNVYSFAHAYCKEEA